MIDNKIDPWLRKISSYERTFKPWEVRVEKIIKRYKDQGRSDHNRETRFNVLWSNVNTIIPAIFARLPKPDVSRRFRDNDPVGRVAGLILERALEYEIDHYDDYRSALRNCILDRYLGGRGVAWVRYEPHFGELDDGAQITEDSDEAQTEILEYECVPVDYVHWKDFGHSLARTWEEVETVWRKVYMGREALVERFGDEGEKIPLDASPDKDRKDADEDNQALIYEIWDKTSGKALWISKSLGKILDEKDDPLELDGFFPCAKPLFSTLSTDDLIPVPDFSLYQDQARELDLLATRIAGLIDSLRIRGVHDAAAPELARLFKEAGDNELIAVKNWQSFAEKNGLKGTIDIVDITPIANALAQAYAAMEQVKGQIYEITGLSDIIRGSSEAAESATAQRIKSQYGSLRLRSMQADVVSFAVGLLRIKAQILCKLFQPQTLLQISSAQQLSQADQQYIEPALSLLKDGNLSDFRIDIQADSMVQMDDVQEKQDRMEFLRASGEFLKQAVTAGAQMPDMAPLLMEMLKYGVTGFKVGKTIEGQFDQTAEQLKMKAEQAKNAPPPPDPEIVKTQGAMQLQQMQQEHEAQLEQFKAQLADQQHQRELLANSQAAQEQGQRDMQLEQWKQDMQARQIQHQNELEAQRELQRQQIESQMELKKQELEAAKELQRIEFERYKLECQKDLEMRKASLQSATQVELAVRAASEKEPSTEPEVDVVGLQVAQTAQMMASILERQDRILSTLAAPKDLLDENGTVIRTVVSRQEQ